VPCKSVEKFALRQEMIRVPAGSKPVTAGSFKSALPVRVSTRPRPRNLLKMAAAAVSTEGAVSEVTLTSVTANVVS
jgi:hypothetical protein